MPIYVGDALLAHAQGGCYRCHRGDSLVDLDAQIVGEGALVLCKGCIAEAAEAADMHLNRGAVDEIQAAHAAERASFGPERVAELEAALTEAENRLAVSEEVRSQLTEALKQPARGRK